MQRSLDQLINSVDTIFFDFDGVIKDSVEAKSLAFEKLFLSYGIDVAMRVRLHHEKNTGMSRFEKIPLYLSWVNESITSENIQNYCNKFSSIVKQSVINADWVPGVQEFITNNYKTSRFILVTATPKVEIDEILEELNIRQFFDEVYGSPTSKNNAISSALISLKIDPEDAILIGDSSSDHDAAMSNGILFILRRTELNNDLQKKCGLNIIEDFNDIQISTDKRNVPIIT
ncbi:HAD hydrolase-like protein [Candidatus Pseudothioglobus singularis]|nr:HAD hydrolase-like protein [Candidatus Pseudothioglobus singularis]